MQVCQSCCGSLNWYALMWIERQATCVQVSARRRWCLHGWAPLAVACLLAACNGGDDVRADNPLPRANFDGNRALTAAVELFEFGPRIAGTAANRAAADWAIERFRRAGWAVTTQSFPLPGSPPTGPTGRNVIASAGMGPAVFVGSHYDTRIFADEDPDPQKRTLPAGGANDGASGIAVLLELARVLDVAATGHTVCLVMFDAEDNGDIGDWEWLEGSRYMVEHLSDLGRCATPQKVLVVDMVGERDQQIFKDLSVTDALQNAVWGVASRLDFGAWIRDRKRFSILDDHRPFWERGVPAAVMIDFQDPHWHTVDDTPDKLSAASLARVGQTVQVWLELGAPSGALP